GAPGVAGRYDFAGDAGELASFPSRGIQPAEVGAQPPTRARLASDDQEVLPVRRPAQVDEALAVGAGGQYVRPLPPVAILAGEPALVQPCAAGTDSLSPRQEGNACAVESDGEATPRVGWTEAPCLPAPVK